ncbi:CorA metal ion transporter [Coemansia javaensis]|uniref:CorA metal ion transporter n=1 Tax=Coemansia javaensis TaxID=2761396 RepID=A0A9W8LG09_9FUNG|nr:CorA metal ion transporter [Coemansia javaensis]
MGKSGRGPPRRRNPNRRPRRKTAPDGEDRHSASPEPPGAQATGTSSSSHYHHPHGMAHSRTDYTGGAASLVGERLRSRLDRQRSYSIMADTRRAWAGDEGSRTPQSRGSGGSPRRRAGSGSPSLASAILQYMPGMDAEDGPDYLAARYYGNMASLPGDAGRRPLPMNSTLPLFSPSVIHGRIASHSRSSRASLGSPQSHERASPYQAAPSQSADQLTAAAARHEMPSIGEVPAEHEAPGGEQIGMATTEQQIGMTTEQQGGVSTEQQDGMSTEHQSGMSAEQQMLAEHHIPAELPQAPAEDHQVVEVRAESPPEPGGGPGIGAGAPSVARGRHGQLTGATQYTPAAGSRRSFIARAAPGLSYMFSPTVSTSRPPSVTGMATPTQQQPPMHLPPQAAHVGALPPADCAHEPPDARQPPDAANQGSATLSGERTMYGAINVGILEHFLEEGKLPDSSSDSASPSDDFGDDSSWGEDDDDDDDDDAAKPISPRAAAVSPRQQQQQPPPSPSEPRESPTVSLRQQTLVRPRPLLHDGAAAAATSPAAQRSPALGPAKISPRIREIRRLSAPDERTPLLLTQPQPQPPEYVVPADLPFAEGQSSAANAHDAYDARDQEQQERRRRRRRRRRHSRKNHEDLFLDKDGFIDGSYRFTFFNPAVGTIRAQEFADLRTPTMDLSALLQVGGCFWIDVLQPSVQEMHLMSKVFGIHALTVEDIITQDAREKCEIHASYYFVCFRSFDNDVNSETYLEPKCVYNIVMREGIITFHMDPTVHQYHVLRRIRRQIDHLVVTPDWLNYAIIDDITDMLAPILHSVEFDVDVIDELVLVISSSEQSDMLLRISTVRKRIMMAMRLLQGKADVVRALIKRFESATAISTTHMAAAAAATAETRAAPASAGAWCESPRYRAGAAGPAGAGEAEAAGGMGTAELAQDQRKGQETLLYLGDVLDHIVTMMQNAAHYDNMLGRAQTNYLAQISIELTESSNNTNDVVAKLSALAAIVVPLNFVTGMWGANVKVPGQDVDNLHYFFAILAMCMLYVVVAVAWARRYNIF